MSKIVRRINAACNYCHRQKVKCSGEQPCQRCRQRHKQCIYRARGDRMVAVSEGYLEHLNSSLNNLTHAIQVTRNHASIPAPITPMVAQPLRSLNHASTTEFPLIPAAEHRDGDESEGGTAPLVKDSTAETFIRKLKEVLQGNSDRSGNALLALATAIPSSSSPYLSRCGEGLAAPKRRHAMLKFDNMHSKLSFKLPPYGYAVQLLSQAEQYFGDYHTFLRKSFWNRLHATYKNPSSQIEDRNWFCRLSFVLALAEANNHNNQPLIISMDGSTETSSQQRAIDSSDDVFHTLPPGTEYFEQGLLMLKVSYEDPTVDDVEALNLASHCSFILNRRKAAYAYAGQSIRLSHSLGLDRPAPSSLSNVQREHRKRVWWTAFCVDRATSTELCLHPAYVGMIDDLDYPDSSSLSQEDLEEFFDPDLLTAQIKLLQIKSEVINVVSQLKSKHIYQPYDLLDQCLKRLTQCRDDMPAYLASTFEFNSRAPLNATAENRVPFSLALRYNQCYILLLRPLLLHQLGQMLRGDIYISFKEEVLGANNICLRAAKINSKIMLHLAASNMLTQYGYWDSVHLFSCLSVMCLAKIMTGWRCQPLALESTEWNDDNALYGQAREVLVNMAQCGNIASKHHLEMLTEIEMIGNVMPQAPNCGARSLGESLTTLSAIQGGGTEEPSSSSFQEGEIRLERELGFDDWAELLGQPVIDFTSFDLYATSLG